MFSVGYESSKSQPHPLNTPIKHTYFVHLNYISCTIHLYRSDVQADYLIQTSLFKILAYMHCSSTLYKSCRFSIEQAQIAKHSL